MHLLSPLPPRVTFSALGLALWLLPTLAMAAEAVTLGVREAAEPAAQRQEFAPSARGVTLPGGFVATAADSPIKGGRRVDMTVADSSGAMREVVLDFRVSVVGRFDQVFVTDGQGPRPLTGAGGTTYRDNCSLPVLTVYGPDGGITVAAPFDVPAPTLRFDWAQTADGVQITATVSHLRLPARGTARAGLLVGHHEGCWRPGLGWIVKLYPEYFDPPNPRVYDYDGPMIYDFITTEQRLRRDLTQGLAWQELGWYWPHLGLYLPEGDTWRRQSGSEGGYGEGGTVTRRMITDAIALARRLGVAECLYFQSTESWAEYAEKNFADSRIRNQNGDLAPTWVKCVVLDPSPDRPFGRHILNQLRGLTRAYPAMSGVFWDQNCYTGFDFAHDDGLSMVNGRRVSMMEFPQEAILKQGGKILHDRGMFIMTNGGWTAGLARYCDGHMSEGTGPTRRLQYLCLRKHLTLLAYDSNPAQGLEKLRLALETGAQPGVTLGDDRCRALFAGYRPIFRMLRRKDWVYTPQALTLPADLAGNIFRTHDGNYLITAVGRAGAPTPAPAEQERPQRIATQLPDAREIACVFELNPTRQGLQAVRTHRRPGGLSVSLPRAENGTAVLLARRGRWIGSGTERLIAGRPQPLALVLANLTDRRWRGTWTFTVGDSSVRRSLDLAPFATGNVSLGPVPVPADAASVAVHVSGPLPDLPETGSVIEMPVVSAVGILLPQGPQKQLLRGESVSFAVANRLPEAATVALRTCWKGAAAPETMRLTLAPHAVRTLSVPADPPGPGMGELQVTAEWPGGTQQRSLAVDVIEAVLPPDFRVDDVTGLTLRLDVFNSLSGQWAEKPVKINGVLLGRLPITESTLRWHEALPLTATAEQARAMLAAGLSSSGDLAVAITVENHVHNCFKLRNAQVTVTTRSGAKYQSSLDREVRCSDPGWLYSEGACVPLGETVRVGPLHLLRRH